MIKNSFLIACCFFAVTSLGDDKVRLNESAFRFAKELIASGNFVADKKGDWRNQRPSVTNANELIRARGWTEYAKWHLGLDPRHRIASKAHYKFPFGDFTAVRRSALLAIRSRAREYGYVDIENAAAELQRNLEQKNKIER